MRWQVRAVLGTNTKLCRWTYLYALFVYEAHCHNTEQQKTTPRLHPPHHTPAPKIIYIIAMQQSLFCCWLPAPSVKVYWCSPVICLSFASFSSPSPSDWFFCSFCHTAVDESSFPLTTSQYFILFHFQVLHAACVIGCFVFMFLRKCSLPPLANSPAD